ncbi:hypothetical protein [Colwellia sp. MEBiC06753]
MTNALINDLICVAAPFQSKVHAMLGFMLAGADLPYEYDPERIINTNLNIDINHQFTVQSPRYGQVELNLSGATNALTERVVDDGQGSEYVLTPAICKCLMGNLVHCVYVDLPLESLHYKFELIIRELKPYANILTLDEVNERYDQYFQMVTKQFYRLFGNSPYGKYAPDGAAYDIPFD